VGSQKKFVLCCYTVYCLNALSSLGSLGSTSFIRSISATVTDSALMLHPSFAPVSLSHALKLMDGTHDKDKAMQWTEKNAKNVRN